MDNTIGPTPDTGVEYAVRVARKALDQQKRDGEGAVALIEGAGKAADPDGKGALIDTHA